MTSRTKPNLLLAPCVGVCVRMEVETLLTRFSTERYITFTPLTQRSLNEELNFSMLPQNRIRYMSALCCFWCDDNILFTGHLDIGFRNPVLSWIILQSVFPWEVVWTKVSNKPPNLETHIAILATWLCTTTMTQPTKSDTSKPVSLKVFYKESHILRFKCSVSRCWIWARKGRRRFSTGQRCHSPPMG